MATNAPTEPMSAEQSTALAEFARSCKTAARSVSLYPATHPAIQGALGRVVTASRRLTGIGEITIAILPDLMVIEGKAPAKPDPAIGEFADLLHHRLVGELHISPGADAAEWRAFLLLLGRSAEELLAEGGISKAWGASGYTHFTVREIDYAEVLRERRGSEGAAWDRIVEFCLQGNDATVEERVLDAVIAALDADRFAELVKAVQSTEGKSASIGARAAALLGLIRKAIERLREQDRLDEAAVLQSVADSAATMTPDMMLSFLQQAKEERQRGDTPLAAPIVERIGDNTIAEFVAGSVVAERGASQRLALAFQALVPELEKKERLLDLAKAVAQQTPMGNESGFNNLWHGAAELLTSYSDESFVSEEYARELSGSRAQALEIERVSDDPADRIQAWLATVSDTAVRDLDLALIQDLLRIEEDPASWQAIAAVASDEVERRTLLGDIATALAAEESNRAIRRLRELLLSFGAAGRQSVEQLKHSPNPGVRRMAIDLLRVFGGREALPELASMLDDADPQVQRESIRAIVQIGTNDAFAVLEHALVSGTTSRDTILQQLIALRDDKAVSLLCYVLNHTAPRGNLVAVHAQIIEAIGNLAAHQDSIRTLRVILYRGEWWAPFRTAALRHAAAAALQHLGTSDAVAVLDEAAAEGSRGVRKVARRYTAHRGVA